MPTGLFVCECCSCVDHIDLAYPHKGYGVTPSQWLCTECQGRPWHNRFSKVPYDSEEDIVENEITGIGLG